MMSRLAEYPEAIFHVPFYTLLAYLFYNRESCCTIMVDILLVFEVHQPFRFRRDFFWSKRKFRKLSKVELLDHYFDHKTDGEIFRRASAKCYKPSNDILLKIIDEYKKEKKDVRIAYSLSGIFLSSARDSIETFFRASNNSRRRGRLSSSVRHTTTLSLAYIQVKKSSQLKSIYIEKQ